MIRKGLLSLAVVLSVPGVAGPAQAQTYYMPDYWITPTGRYANLFTVNRTDPPPSQCQGQTSTGTHAFWQGTLWGKPVALQGGIEFDDPRAAYDIFVLTPAKIEYWGTFRGNDYYSQSEENHSFGNAAAWMNYTMNLGQQITTTNVSVTVMLNHHRAKGTPGSLTITVKVDAHFPGPWIDPDSGIPYYDVLRVLYIQTDAAGTRTETYYLARGIGTVRFDAAPDEPSCIAHQYATSSNLPYTQPATPALPWFDPFNNSTFVKNGFFEDTLIPPSPGGAIATYEKAWSSGQTPANPDVVITMDAGEPPAFGTSPWKIALRGSAGGGDTSPDFAISDPIPVTPNNTYRLFGCLWRSSDQDRVYLDFNDGVFGDVDITTDRIGEWDCVHGEATVKSATSVQVRCVRDSQNQGNAYCDGVTLYSLGAPQAPQPGAGLFTITPCRIADTRTSGPALSANTTRNFQVSGLCSIPSGAIGVALNMTVVDPTNSGWLRVYAADVPMPPSSSISFSTGKTRGNNAQIGISTNGQIAIRCDMPSGTTHLVLDVQGYFQ